MEIIHLLIDYGANLKCRNAQGKSALDLAAPKSGVEQALLLREGKEGLGVRFSSTGTFALSPSGLPSRLSYPFLFVFLIGSGTWEGASPSISEMGFCLLGVFTYNKGTFTYHWYVALYLH